MEFSEEKLNQCKMELIYIERKNARSKEKSDITMVKDIIKIISRTLEERYQNWHGFEMEE